MARAIRYAPLPWHAPCRCAPGPVSQRIPAWSSRPRSCCRRRHACAARGCAHASPALPYRHYHYHHRQQSLLSRMRATAASAPYRRLALRRSFRPQHGHPGSSLTIQMPHCWQRTWPASYRLFVPGLLTRCRAHVPRQAIMTHAPSCRVRQHKRMIPCGGGRFAPPPSWTPPRCSCSVRSSREQPSRLDSSPLHSRSNNGNFVFILYDKYVVRNGRQGRPARRTPDCPLQAMRGRAPGVSDHNTRNNNHI